MAVTVWIEGWKRPRKLWLCDCSSLFLWLCFTQTISLYSFWWCGNTLKVQLKILYSFCVSILHGWELFKMSSQELVEGEIYDTRRKRTSWGKKSVERIVIIKLLLLKSSHKVLESHTRPFLWVISLMNMFFPFISWFCRRILHVVKYLAENRSAKPFFFLFFFLWACCVRLQVMACFLLLNECNISRKAFTFYESNPFCI